MRTVDVVLVLVMMMVMVVLLLMMQLLMMLAMLRVRQIGSERHIGGHSSAKMGGMRTVRQ